MYINMLIPSFSSIKKITVSVVLALQLFKQATGTHLAVNYIVYRCCDFEYDEGYGIIPGKLFTEWRRLYLLIYLFQQNLLVR